jgi:hypothetical protein
MTAEEFHQGAWNGLAQLRNGGPKKRNGLNFFYLLLDRLSVAEGLSPYRLQ